jgi:hypothetical protein
VLVTPWRVIALSTEEIKAARLQQRIKKILAASTCDYDIAKDVLHLLFAG